MKLNSLKRSLWMNNLNHVKCPVSYNAYNIPYHLVVHILNSKVCTLTISIDKHKKEVFSNRKLTHVQPPLYWSSEHTSYSYVEILQYSRFLFQTIKSNYNKIKLLVFFFFLDKNQLWIHPQKSEQMMSHKPRRASPSSVHTTSPKCSVT